MGHIGQGVKLTTHALEMSSSSMIYVPGFVKFGSAIAKLIGTDIQGHRRHGDRISPLLLFQNKENRQKYGYNNLFTIVYIIFI
jgi:hypothetical protein